MLSYSTFRKLVFFLSLMVLATICFAHNASAQKQSAAPPTPSSATGSAAASEADTDSADIPPFARGLISEEEYFALRDQEVRTRRGTADLLRNPQARSQAVRTMQFMERVLRVAPQGLNPFSALIPAAAGTTWTPLGPDPIPNGQTDPTGNPANERPVSGRVTAIAVDPVSELIVYVGTAQGGVYRTLDGGSTWLPLLDSGQSLAIGPLTIDPLNRDTLFVGTGEGNLSGDSFFGVGLYIIRSASTVNPVVTGPFNAPVISPNPDGFSDVFTGRSITQILVNPADDNQILVSTSSGFSGLSSDTFSTLPTRGVYLSTNAQSATPTFSRLTIQTASANRIVTDMAMDPGNANLVAAHVFGLAAAADGGVWVSTTSPWTGTGTWQQTLIEQADNGKFAVNRSGTPTPVTTFLLALDNSVVTACGAGHGGSLFKSTDGGQTWPELTAARGFCGGQCFYDAVPAMSPDTPSTIFLGGPGDSLTPAVGSCGNAIMAKSIDGGTSFARSDNLLHPDSHVFVFAPSNHAVAYTGNDGGIFRSADGGATWTSLNTAGFYATQFMSLSVHPTDPNFTIGGTQDNGTEFMRPDGTWIRADFGDGGYSAIDQGATSTSSVNMYHTFFNSTGIQLGYASATTAAGATEGNWTLRGCFGGLSANGITCTDNVLFYAPLALGPGTPNTVYFGTDHLYRSPDNGSSHTVVSQSPFPGIDPINNGNPRVTAIGISPQDDNVRIVGLTTGHVFATTAGANPMTDVTGGWTPKFIARAVIDPNNKATAYVTLDGYGTPSHVWKTTSLAGEPPTPTWTAASTGLPDVPVNAFAIDPANSNSLYAGTDIGVFNSTDGGATWLPFGTGLPRVAVFDLNMQKSSRTIKIGTHGRGAWEIAAANVPIAPDYSINAANGKATIVAGQSASITFTITPQGGFAGTVSFACSGLPTASSCTFSPATVTASGNTTLTLMTTARTVASAQPLPGSALAALAAFCLLGTLFFGGVSSQGRTLRVLCMLLAIGIVVGGVSSCGGGGGNPPPPPPPTVTGTPAGSFNVTVTATSGATTHSSVITLVVQ